MEQQLPAAIRNQFAMISCLKHSPDKQVYVMADRLSGGKVLLKCASGEKAKLLATESNFLKSKNFSFLPAFHSCMQEDSSFYLIREYIEGETLEEYVECREMLPVKEALSILYDIAGFIETLHAQNPPILHRDIKPQNFLKAADGRLFMLDVETVRTYDSSAEHDTMIVGTRSIAAPEQFGYSQTSVQSDIYALGMLFLYLVTGDYSRRKQNYAFLPRSMRQLIQKCTHFDPSKRYGSIRSLRRDIASILRWRMRFLSFGLTLLITALALTFSAGLLVRQQQIRVHKEQSVSFENPLIEQAARQALHKSDTDTLTRQELSQIRSLLLVEEYSFDSWNSYVNYYNLQWFQYAELAISAEAFPLEDLRYFTGLKELALDVQNISDLSALQELPLEKLSLKKSNITDISSLASISSLKLLWLADNPLTDISAVSHLSALEELDIMNTSVSDIQMLENSSLNTLSCGYTGITDYSCLTSMPYLTNLRVSHLDEDDIAFINSLSRLELLTLNESRLNSLDDIRNLTRLTSLDLGGCQDIATLDGITNFPSLDYLCISSTSISNLTPAAGLVKLSCLEFSYAPIEDFTPLNDCRKLNQLYLNQAMADELERQLPGHSYNLIIIDP